MIFLFNLVFFLVFIYVLKQISPNLKLIDKPDERKLHTGNIPLIGGLAIYANILILLFFFDVSNSLRIIIFTSSILVFLGAIDDSIELGVKFRLLAQLISCLFIIGFGIQIETLGYIFLLGELNLNYFAIIFTVFCVIGLTNAFNFIDGIDGLCSSQSLISMFSILLIIFFYNEYYNFQDIQFIFYVIFIIFLFFIFNISNINKIFLGDAGSMFLGFFIAWLLILFSQDNYKLLNPLLTIWCVTLPVFDIISVVSRRILNKTNPFIPDREHIHHLFLNMGYSNKFTLIILIMISIFLNLIGLITFHYLGNLVSLIVFILLSLIYTLIMKFLSNKVSLLSN